METKPIRKLNFSIENILINFFILGVLPFVAGWIAVYFIFDSPAISIFCYILCIFVGMTLHKIIYRKWYMESGEEECNINDYIDIEDNMLE